MGKVNTGSAGVALAAIVASSSVALLATVIASGPSWLEYAELILAALGNLGLMVVTIGSRYSAPGHIRPRWWITLAALMLVVAACISTVAFAVGGYAIAWTALSAVGISAMVLIVADEMGWAN